MCKERFKGRVSLYPGFVKLSSGSVAGCKVEDCYTDFRKALFLKNIFEKHNIYSSEIYPFIQSKGCMANQLNGLLIGPEGELYKCWHHLGNKEKIVGSVFEKSVFTNVDYFADCMLKQGLFDEQCKQCVLFPSCGSGCFDMREKNENYCIPAKTMLEDFLEIHYEMKKRESLIDNHDE